ncbi:MAG: arginase family protein [Acidobacteria bacterium]|nr:arginase family protein [Acidobacteriota bacterium]MCL5287116.1 arginase family protein [Acidobacteriota bacterium]
MPVPFAGCFTSDPAAKLVFAGLPDDSQSSFRRGAARGPAALRLAYDGDCNNSTSESGCDLAGKVFDAGDLPPLSDWSATARSFREFAAAQWRAGKIPFFAGGDHAVTVPIAEALAVLGHPVHIIQLDAHPDLYPVYEGSTTSHACVAARLLEMSHVASLTQYGIRTENAVQADCARRHSGRLRQFHARTIGVSLNYPAHIPHGAPVYITLDLDAFDPAFAPGVAHSVPGGLTPRQVLNFLQFAPWSLVGMDVVELNPDADANHLTALLAARCLHEAMAFAMAHLA